ncbi:MAG: hypothetical protein N2C12_11855, partial [Planctomycetales bacterium]
MHKVMYVTFALLFVLTTASYAEGTKASDNRLSFASEEFGWTLMYPDDWSVDADDPAFIKLNAPPPDFALVGIHSVNVQFDSLDPLVQAVMLQRGGYFASQGKSYSYSGRKVGFLEGGIAFIELFDEIGGEDGGKSQILVTLVEE